MSWTRGYSGGGEKRADLRGTWWVKARGPGEGLAIPPFPTDPGRLPHSRLCSHVRALEEGRVCLRRGAGKCTGRRLLDSI